MLHAGGAVAIVLVCFWVYCLLDVIATDESLMRNLPKIPWVLIVLLFNPVGGIAWLLLGRPQGTAMTPGSTAYRTTSRPLLAGPSPGAPLGPDDAADFLTELDRRKQQAEEERLRAWEEDLRRREDDRREDDRRGDDAEPGEQDGEPKP